MKHDIEMSLDGRLLKRGFWIYVWKIHTNDNREFYYVGRTGYSSSNNAGSPFNRMTVHFNSKAKGNSLYKNLLVHDVDLETSTFKMYAHGPLFEEQATFEEHKVIRDKMAVIERQVALMLTQRSHMVIGSHSAPKKADEADIQLASLIVDNASKL